MKVKTLQPGDPEVRPRRGAVLVGALILLITISIMGATLASMFTSVTTIADLELARTQSLYLAEAGISAAIHELHAASESGAQPALKIAPTRLGEGTYAADIDFITGTITATGSFRGIDRTIQIKYHVF